MYIVPNGAEERDVPRPNPSFLFFRVCVCRPLIALPAITAASFPLRLLFSARDRAEGLRRAEEERDDYSSFSAGGREGDEVPRE